MILKFICSLIWWQFNFRPPIPLGWLSDEMGEAAAVFPMRAGVRIGNEGGKALVKRRHDVFMGLGIFRFFERFG
jgi:hypothetical protein